MDSTVREEGVRVRNISKHVYNTFIIETQMFYLKGRACDFLPLVFNHKKNPPSSFTLKCF